MKGLIALVGAGEYLPVMNEIDRHLLTSVNLNGQTPRVVCMPTAAGQESDASVERWLNMGVKHFEALGAEVTPARIVDRDSANDLQWVSVLENADLIYFSGGNPMYLYETMQGSRAWDAAIKAWTRGAVYAGCSAGAMILADRVPNIRSAGLKSIDAFQIFPATFIIPHFDRMRGWASAYLFAVRRQLKEDQFILGVDENTALVGKIDGKWQVMGEGKAHLITRADEQAFDSGQEVLFSI
ncbi:MAG: type 1 glutamine amidotransferase-like domain-containing protein [Anaerolineae bacterium]|jgi:cyanophycinase|nr:type 1 glutamine amidotransferase-like domain-containing protein [Anaerolineae bacterium]MBT3713222.1 type 1 glutamine amidotransferase-like domain-containing protein [Anaerolineae bacterium]MBT4312539.1 type 1 glutamine amidotransferase-like domain-containing protein [Anaerolineae bacterium]MBT4457662.1 type 1 glutamine amidotransferase-like domain-containing protein [Anaerolineae bacterium]MBT4841157.1 type 1 glutamine amidotransferase-like domain-containing protein [Anaerolineae bacterium